MKLKLYRSNGIWKASVHGGNGGVSSLTVGRASTSFWYVIKVFTIKNLWRALVPIALVLLPLFLSAQCGYLLSDTAFNNSATLITATTARLNSDVSNGDVAGTTVTVRYVRVGFTDTVVSTTAWPVSIRNITGLQSGTQYVYYYTFNCLTQVLRQIGRYYFTTLQSQVVYATERSTVFPYVKTDSGFVVPRIDTLLYKQPATTGGNIVFNPADSVFYGWNKSRWVPLMNSTAGISNKVDSVTVGGDTLLYWINGTGYGEILPSAVNIYNTNGALTGDRVVTTDGKKFEIGSTGERQFILDPVTKYWALGDWGGDFGNATSIHIADSTGEVRVDGYITLQEVKPDDPGLAVGDFYPVFYNDNSQAISAGSGVDSIWRASDSLKFRVRSSIVGKAGTFGIYAPSGGGTVTGTGTANTMTKFTGTSSIGNSSVTDDGTTVTSSVDLSLSDGLYMPNSTTSVGSIYFNGTRFIQNYNPPNTDGGNVFIGRAGNVTMAWDGVNSYTAARNVAIGESAMLNNTTGYFNNAIGYESLKANTTGAGNAVLGSRALLANTTAHDNAAIGDNALYSNTFGYENQAVGYRSLYLCDSGYRNVAVGYSAGYNLVDGFRNTFLGSETNVSSGIANTVTNSTAIGYAANITASNQIVLGTSAVTEIVANGTLAANEVGANIRIRADGTIAKDGGVFTNAGGDIWFSNYDANRGFKILAAGQIQTLSTFMGIGGLTSSFPGIKRNGITLQVRLGDDSGDAILTAGSVGAAVASPTSTLHTTSFATAYRAITALRTLDATDHTVDATSGTYNITLPTAVGCTGRIYTIKNSGAGVITIATTSSQTIDGVTTKTLNVQYTGYTVQSNGANWIIIAAF